MQWSCHKHIPITIMSILEWNLHDMNEMLLLMIPVSSPHRLLSTCNMPCMKTIFKTKIFVLFVDNPPILISRHTPISYFVDNPPIYNSGHTPIIYCVGNPPIYNSGHTPIKPLYSKAMLGNLRSFMQPFRTFSLDQNQHQHQTQC